MEKSSGGKRAYTALALQAQTREPREERRLQRRRHPPACPGHTSLLRKRRAPQRASVRACAENAIDSRRRAPLRTPSSPVGTKQLLTKRADRRLEAFYRYQVLLGKSQQPFAITHAPMRGADKDVLNLARFVVAAVSNRRVGIGDRDDARRVIDPQRGGHRFAPVF